MSSAKKIVALLVSQGVIPEEFEDVAVLELHRELTRRSRRLAQTLAAMASMQQLAFRFAELQA